MKRTSLILGGARSGKSRYGEERARLTGLERIYVATARAGDDEMRQRIAAHRVRRSGHGWHAVEEDVELPQTITAFAAPDRVILVDCLTLWLTNLLVDRCDCAARCADLLDVITRVPGDLILVSGEVGLGIVPENRLARTFRDLTGRLHQDIAQRADTVVMMVAGLPLVVKSPEATP